MSYIGNEPIVSATRTITEVTATAGQTVFNANGGYTVGYLDVFLNGAQLQTVDFTATNGSSVTLTEAAQVNDVVRLVAWGTFSTNSIQGNLTLTGTAARITGDFSNATVANRVLFQTSTTNGNTTIGVLPNGTGQATAFTLFTDSNTTNGSALTLRGGADTNDARIIAGVVSGTNLPLTMYTAGGERLRIDTSGNVGIGTSSPAFGASRNGLVVKGNTTNGGEVIIQTSVDTGATGLALSKFGIDSSIFNRSSGFLNFGTSDAERIRIRADGSLLHTGGAGAGAWAELGNNNADSTYPATGGLGCAITWNFTGGGRENAFMNCDVDGGGFRWLQRTGTSTNNYVGAAGRFGAWFQGNNSSTWSTTSDIRVKDNIRPISDALGKINSLNPCHFEYKDKLGKTKTGFIAQEFGEIFPGHIVEETHVPEQYREFIPEGESLKGIDADLIPYLVKALQEQQAIIQSQTDTITAMEAQLTDINLTLANANARLTALENK
jgi:hypothetical protein